MSITLNLKSPLFTDWTEQYVKLRLAGVAPGTPLSLTVDGRPAPFQYTGVSDRAGAEVRVRLAFEKDEVRTLAFEPAERCETDLKRKGILLEGDARIGVPGREISILAPRSNWTGLPGVFASFAGFPMKSSIGCEAKLVSERLTRTNTGPLFIDYELEYLYAEHRGYTVVFRCCRDEPCVEVAERFSLGMGAELTWTINPERVFDHILSHRGPEFEGEPQPVVEPLGQDRPADVLCRLQMPVLSEYFIPNNRGWFAFFNSRDEARGMVGVMGLYGAKWIEPVENMPEVLEREGAVEWHASLASGARYWLLYAGPVEKTFASERRFVFHRLHAEFNALRLDEHLDLTGETLYDESCWNAPGFFVGDDVHEQARCRAEALPCLKKAVQEADHWSKQNAGGHLATLHALLDPTPGNLAAVHDGLIVRFEKWVRQFQGYRVGEHDYMKNVIGFSRWLRGMLIAYELLRKEGCLTREKIGRLNAYFCFAARRIRDEGRWPHSKTWLHPDHPESTRDLYRYGGEHRPDRLVWTNSLPNFQSDPICALAHLSAIFPDHPDARGWARFALDDLDRQLTAYCGESGAWEESINYALYTYSYFMITFRPLKYRLGIDYFNDERMRRFTGWLCRYFGPFDKRVGAYSWPPIGNAIMPSLGGGCLLACAAELAEDDPLRADCIAVYQKQEDDIVLMEHYPNVMAAMAPIPDREYPLRPLASEHMAELGVAMRHDHPGPRESYLVQKIGFWKDHYENDESAFSWHAKGTPLAMDYGTYTGDVGIGAAHNLVEIPDMDPLRRGFLANHLFSPTVDYTHCEMPVTLKLLWGCVRSFDEIDNKHGKVAREKTPYFYIGDENPVGPKVWKTRLLLFVKPDYLAVFDRVYGDVPHRYNLHAVADEVCQDGNLIVAGGRFDLDLWCYVQHPATFEVETGEIVPNYAPAGNEEVKRLHRQRFVRLYNHADGLYRTLLFAKERERALTLETAGRCGIKVTTPEYTDYVFMHNKTIREVRDDVRFTGCVGWIRRSASGEVQACVPWGDLIEAFGVRIDGRGPWTYNAAGDGEVELKGGPPRCVKVTTAG